MKFKQEVYPFKIAVLISGNGTTLENLLININKGILKANVAVVLSSNSNAYGLSRAAQWNIPRHVIPYSQYQHDIHRYSQLITEVLSKYHPNLIVMAGFLSRYIVPKVFKGKVINIHPSLIPEFCGKGFYGRRVHEAVKKSNVAKTGCTVHFVDNEYDHGSIIAQEDVAVNPNDTVETIQEKVTVLEHQLYPRVINMFVEKFI